MGNTTSCSHVTLGDALDAANDAVAPLSTSRSMWVMSPSDGPSAHPVVTASFSPTTGFQLDRTAWAWPHTFETEHHRAEALSSDLLAACATVPVKFECRGVPMAMVSWPALPTQFQAVRRWADAACRLRSAYPGFNLAGCETSPDYPPVVGCPTNACTCRYDVLSSGTCIRMHVLVSQVVGTIVSADCGFHECICRLLLDCPVEEASPRSRWLSASLPASVAVPEDAAADAVVAAAATVDEPTVEELMTSDGRRWVPQTRVSTSMMMTAWSVFSVTGDGGEVGVARVGPLPGCPGGEDMDPVHMLRCIAQSGCESLPRALGFGVFATPRGPVSFAVVEDLQPLDAGTVLPMDTYLNALLAANELYFNQDVSMQGCVRWRPAATDGCTPQQLVVMNLRMMVPRDRMADQPLYYTTRPVLGAPATAPLWVDTFQTLPSGIRAPDGMGRPVCDADWLETALLSWVIAALRVRRGITVGSPECTVSQFRSNTDYIIREVLGVPALACVLQSMQYISNRASLSAKDWARLMIESANPS